MNSQSLPKREFQLDVMNVTSGGTQLAFPTGPQFNTCSLHEVHVEKLAGPALQADFEMEDDTGVVRASYPLDTLPWDTADAPVYMNSVAHSARLLSIKTDNAAPSDLRVRIVVSA